MLVSAEYDKDVLHTYSEVAYVWTTNVDRPGKSNMLGSAPSSLPTGREAPEPLFRFLITSESGRAAAWGFGERAGVAGWVAFWVGSPDRYGLGKAVGASR
jgi:hypothetical protein